MKRVSISHQPLQRSPRPLRDERLRRHDMQLRGSIWVTSRGLCVLECGGVQVQRIALGVLGVMS